jgi:hypothetical protein
MMKKQGWPAQKRHCRKSNAEATDAIAAVRAKHRGAEAGPRGELVEAAK